MFKPINTVQPLSKSDYKDQSDELRLTLLTQQVALSKEKKPVILVLAGDDRSGRHETINTLMGWLDPRFIRVNAYGPYVSPDETKPFFWRFWQDLPGAGRIGIYLREWTSTSIVQYLNGEISEDNLTKRTEHIRQFEKTLCDDGALIIKIWLHLSKESHQQRLLDARNTAFFDPKDELALQNYEQALTVIDSVLEATNSPSSSWHIIQADDPAQRDIVAGKAIARQIEHWLDSQAPTTATTPPPSLNDYNILDAIDLSKSIDKKIYKDHLAELQEQLRGLMKQVYKKGLSIICVFEGTDAAGKGGAIRRLVATLDAGQYRIIPVAKPNDEEYAHHYLWRFWRNIPDNGMMTIFDRSWYGRVLVERVEEFARDDEWQRAYAEINDFEKQLADHGVLIKKFWLHIDQDEQLKRFKAREQTPHKMHKITDEDYRNRKKWPQYHQAIHDMVTQTDTDHARWTLISAQDKKYARTAVLQSLIDLLEANITD
ncbi:MAG: polyphosphate:AMP phosphotransferase [Reinekea sp.]|jgi:AMP-polyphosphate phosphotransferase